MRLITLLMLLVFPVGATASPPIALNSDDEIHTIEQLDGRVEQLVAKIRQCAAAGLAPASECHCYYPEKLRSTQQAYQRVVNRHPDWEGRAVLWWDNNAPSPSNLHMGGIKNQISRPCT